MRALFNAIKRAIVGIATGQLLSGYKKDKVFKSKVDNAEGFDKLKVAGEYLVDTNKQLIQETDIDAVVKNVKKTVTQAKSQVETIDKKKVIKDIKSTAKKVVAQAGQQRDNIVDMLSEKVAHIETEVMDFEENAKEYAEDTRTEYYRQISSKFALFKKSVSKYIIEGALAAEEQFNLEKKIQFIADKLEELKSKK